ncbi:MAG: hypothetical protein KDE27_25510 [Planctomycetes bacterium]|nr:hypothetical protein [Planctomycetota bacterium]
MAAKKNKAGYDFIVAALKKDKNAAYSDIAAAAKKKGMSIFPIMYGRAKAALGLVASKPRGSKRAAAAGPRRGPGRPRKNAAPTHDGSLESIVAAVKGNEQAKARYRSALEKIQAIIADALA